MRRFKLAALAFESPVRRCMATLYAADLGKLPGGSGHRRSLSVRRDTIGVLAVGESARQVQIAAVFWVRLAERSPPEGALYTQRDNVVVPSGSAAVRPRLVGLNRAEHASLLFRPGVFRPIAQFIPDAKETETF